MKKLLNLKNIAIALLIVIVVFQQCGGNKKTTGEIVNYKGKKSSIYFNLGIANFELNKIFESLSFFEMAIDLEPKNLKFITTLLGTSHFLEQNSFYYKKYLNIFRDAIEFHDSSIFHKYSYLNKFQQSK